MLSRIEIISLVLLFGQCSCQIGFPKQFQATLNISSLTSWPISPGVQDLLYDLTNSRVRFDIEGWRAKQKEAYLLIYKPQGAESGSPASQTYTMFDLNPDYPEKTKNNCWYRANPMGDIGPFPSTWFADSQGDFQILPWFPLPEGLINKGEEWVPEIQQKATRYDSPDICNLKRSSIGRVPCLSYYEIEDRPVKTIVARAARGAYDTDDYTVTVYVSFTHGIPSEAEKLFDLPQNWPSYCGNANAGFSIEPIHGFVVTPDGDDNFTLTLTSPPVSSLGDQVQIEFTAIPNWYYNATQCARFNPIIFNKDNWQESQQVTMSFINYGCCNYLVKASGGGYDWLYNSQSFVVYACDGQAGYGCKGKEPCGA